MSAVKQSYAERMGYISNPVPNPNNLSPAALAYNAQQKFQSTRNGGGKPRSKSKSKKSKSKSSKSKPKKSRSRSRSPKNKSKK